MSIRVRSLIHALVTAAIGGVVYAVSSHKLPSMIVMGIAVVILVSGQVAPPVYRFIERGGRALGRVVTIALTWVLLVPFFCVCFVPAGIVLRLLGKDPLHRAFPAKEKTCWTPRFTVSGKPDRYKRQY